MMSDFSKLNGYDVKDAQARGSIETLNNDIASLNLTKIKAHDTVSDMKNDTTLEEGTHVKTNGYFAHSDGGSALYKIRLITNDDVIDEASIIELYDNTLIAELIIEGSTVNAKQFGVYGDNTHDDSTNLQKAINYCESNNLGLYIGSGNYLIGTTLNVTGCSIKGESSTNTIFHLNNCDGLLLKQYNKQNICVIESIAFQSDNVNVEIAGVTYEKYDSATTIRSRGYKLTNLYFKNLGCGIEIQDAFRNTLVDIGMNDCFRCLFIKEQVVQCSFINIVANNDLPSDTTSTRFGDTRNSGLSIGVQIGVAGETKRPEGIKLSQVCCTNFNVGCYHYDSLYFNANQCEFDLCSGQGIIIFSGEGGTIFNGCWIANKSTSTSPIVDILTSSTSTLFYKGIINCTIRNSSTQNDVVGIYLGSNTAYGQNMNIIGCNISSSTGASLKYGIYSNKIRNATIKDNSIFGSTTSDIKFESDRKAQLLNNKCNTMDITIYGGSTLYALNNIYDTKNLSNAGTLVGNFD